VPKKKPYHHGDLSSRLLEVTAEVIDDVGVAGLSLREVARRAGVSHGAPAHHFGDKRGLLTAFATQGFARFGDALEAARCSEDSGNALQRFEATGVAYVQFAVEHEAHFDVMFRPDLVDASDEAYAAASTRAYQQLLLAIQAAQAEGYAPGVDVETLAVAAWAKTHGLATLWLEGNLRNVTGYEDVSALARAVLALDKG
jgi:AcrR family transcriptional regulator